MLASLPMYDLPPLRAITDAWWSGLARAFEAEGIRQVPSRLDRSSDVETQWRSGELLFSQTCGYPLTHALKGAVTLLATPVYACPGVEGPHYHSLILVREDDPADVLADLRGRRAAVNGRDSQSGYSALRSMVAPLAEQGKFFAVVTVSGGHAESMAMVARGEADVCAVDCVTYHLWARMDPKRIAGLRQLAVSPAAPNLPYITRGAADDDLQARLRAGLCAALDDPGLASVRANLLLCGLEVLPLKAYDRISVLENDAVARGYPDIA